MGTVKDVGRRVKASEQYKDNKVTCWSRIQVMPTWVTSANSPIFHWLDLGLAQNWGGGVEGGGTFFGCTMCLDEICSILGSLLWSPYLGNYHSVSRRRAESQKW